METCLPTWYADNCCLGTGGVRRKAREKGYHKVGETRAGIGESPMKKTEARIVCDLCEEPRSSAEIRCDKHQLDLCTSHMRAHFVRRKCRLVPVDRESTVSEQLSEKINATLNKLRKPPRHAAGK